jgi:SP family arabinose:H+ symporter-like MFS transporter
LGPVLWVMLSEIFPNRLRGLAITVVGSFGGLISFIVVTVFPVELEHFGSSVTFFLFAGFGLISLLFILAFVPETKGKSLEELENILVKTITR